MCLWCGCGMVCNLPVNICTYAMYRNDEAETDFDVVKETNQLPPTDDKRDSIRPDTPPSREEAFEQFKREKGKEINRVLMENKGT